MAKFVMELYVTGTKPFEIEADSADEAVKKSIEMLTEMTIPLKPEDVEDLDVFVVEKEYSIDELESETF